MNIPIKLQEAVDKAWVRHEEPRGYLGASSLGGPCSRQLWYGFRWATEKAFPPRVLRLFSRGDREEAVFEQLMSDAGVEFYDRDPATGKQFLVTFPNPHVGGHSDGVGNGLPDLPPGTPFIAEWKTHNHKSFTQLVKQGVLKSKPVHAVQMQLYMHRLEIQWALYGAVNKNDDTLYWELLEYDEKVAVAYENRANLIVWSLTPPNRLSENPGWYECKWCDHHPVCHKGEPMNETCRSCAHVHPLVDGNWWCGEHDKILQHGEQLAGCVDHVEIS